MLSGLTCGVGMRITGHLKGSDDAPHLLGKCRVSSLSHFGSQFRRTLCGRQELRAAAMAREEGERASTEWSTLLNNLNRSATEEEAAARVERALSQRLSKTIREQNLFRPGEKILVAVSGGQDSVSLLHMLASLREHWAWELGVLYCDHRWAASSRSQGEHVAQIATSLGVRYYQAVTTLPVPGESLARTWRYAALQRIALRHGYASIVTAHTASDRVETLLHNLFRGSGLHGLQSLTWKRLLSPALALSHRTAFTPSAVVSHCASTEHGTVNFERLEEVALVRPLLGFTRTEIREYCDLLGLPLWPDASNMSLEIDRNRIRHELLPYLREKFNVSVDKSLARCAEILHAEQHYLDTVCDSILRKAESRHADGSSNLDVVILQSLPVALQRRVVKQFVESFTGRSLGFDHVERLRASFSQTQNTSYGVNLALPGNATVRVSKTHFHLTRTKQA